MSRLKWIPVIVLILVFTCAVQLRGQQTVGSITGVVSDISGAVVPGAQVKATSSETGLQLTTTTNARGAYGFFGVPPGTYSVTFNKKGFEEEAHSQVIVQGNRTTTVNGRLAPGSPTTSVTVTATPLMNQTNATTGYVVTRATIQNTPLGTGSFTQLAILSPGVHADFLGGAGANAGLGNQAIFANGNRDTSNSFSLNGISTNNEFNGNSTSQVGENRFALNTGENFGPGGVLTTSTSVYAAIGQALPTPPPDAIDEITVNSSMYDATQGNNSGAHIGVVTKSGTNHLHGSAWEEWQNSKMNAAPFFYNKEGLTNPFMNRNMFGATIGGPIKRNKLFFFGSYQGVRVSDASVATQVAAVPLGLTSDRSQAGLINAANLYIDPTGQCGTTDHPACFSGAIDPVAMALLNAKLPNGKYLIPSAQPGVATSSNGAGDVVVQGANSRATVDQGIFSLDYQMSDTDRLSGKYYIQSNPTSNPFGYEESLLGFAQQLSAGSQVVSIMNSRILSPTATWEIRAGFTRLRAFGATSSDISPSQMGITLPGAGTFPYLEIDTTDQNLNNGLSFGVSPSFGNAGMYQNQWELESSLNMVKGRHTISIGGQLERTQLNIINQNTNTATLEFRTFPNFLQGQLASGDAFAGSANRYYRSNTAGLYVNDAFKVRSNLTVTYGLRWDFDGPLSEKYGRLTGFNPALYSYDAATDTITNAGLEIAGNNSTSGTKGASDSLMTQHQWGIAPRIGIAWSPYSKLTVRAGYGIYYDRGELFSYFSPSAGSGYNGPFGVTLAPPFVEPIRAGRGAPFSAPFGTAAIPAPSGNAASYLALLPNVAETSSGYWPAGNYSGPLQFGGYDIHNKLPYTENWTLDLQYQLSNDWLFEFGYVGNHGVHEILPVPFNQPLIATPQHPVNGQIYSYGGLSPYSVCNTYYNGFTPLVSEPLCPGPYYAGNAEVRVPYIGYDMNSETYNAEGISNYDALQVQVHRRMSKGLQLTAAYTWSHALDEQSGLGLFVTGNNPLVPKSNYASSDFDQTHVFLINYSYTLPGHASSRALGAFVKGWTINGQTIAQSGQPYSPYDYSGSVAGLYYGTWDEIANPIVPLKPGVSAAQAKLQGTTGVNAGQPVLNPNDFLPTFVAPGTYGVPPCDPTLPPDQGCDLYESLYGTTGRNMFRGPFQVRFDMGLAKTFGLHQERYHLRFEADAFNVFNQTSFDTPNNDVSFFPYYSGPPSIPPYGHLGMIQHTIGSPRFLQLGVHFMF